MEDILRRLGNRIREFRIQRGFKSQEEFADYCHMHRTFLGHLETGRKDFRLTTVIRVAHALGITLQELFGGIETGEALKPEKTARNRASDMEQISKEVATMERSIQKLRRIAEQSPLPPRTSKAKARRKK